MSRKTTLITTLESNARKLRGASEDAQARVREREKRMDLEKARRDKVAELVAEPRAVVLYEAPHRLLETLGDLSAAGGGARPLVVAREVPRRGSNRSCPAPHASAAALGC